MEVRKAIFTKSAVKPKDYPESDLPEIAFVGRSNVGKSSLINVLVNRKNLVRTSSTPGRTQLINFFDCDGKLVLVDLPGYGFARVPLEVKKQWRPMIETYLEKRECLKGVVVILDIRRTPSDEDQQMIRWLGDKNIPAITVITKCDKLTRNQRERQLSVIAGALGRERSALLPFSALSREGTEGVWRVIEKVSGLSHPGN